MDTSKITIRQVYLKRHAAQNLKTTFQNYFPRALSLDAEHRVLRRNRGSVIEIKKYCQAGDSNPQLSWLTATNSYGTSRTAWQQVYKHKTL